MTIQVTEHCWFLKTFLVYLWQWVITWYSANWKMCLAYEKKFSNGVIPQYIGSSYFAYMPHLLAVILGGLVLVSLFVCLLYCLPIFYICLFLCFSIFLTPFILIYLFIENIQARTYVVFVPAYNVNNRDATFNVSSLCHIASSNGSWPVVDLWYIREGFLFVSC